MRRILFVTWDGPDQNYLEALFLPMFERVSEATGCHFDVLQFMSGPAEPRQRARLAAEEHGIGYRGVAVGDGNSPAKQALRIARGSAEVAAEVHRRRSDTLFPRSLMPAAMCLMALRALPGTRFAFDADGLMADERVDFAGWNTSGLPYRILREVESQSIRRAEGVMTRTHAARAILLDRAGGDVPPERIVVAPNAKDERAFDVGTPAQRQETRELAGVPRTAPWLIYAGSLGPQYYPERMATLFRLVTELEPNARMHVLTGQPELFLPHVPSNIRSAVTARRVSAHEVPRFLSAADVGMALREPTYSQRAVSPIKVGEYVLCGLPVIATAGVGDLDQQLTHPDLGLRLEDVSDSSLQRAAGWITTQQHRRDVQREACRKLGLEIYGTRHAIEAYCRVLHLC